MFSVLRTNLPRTVKTNAQPFLCAFLRHTSTSAGPLFPPTKEYKATLDHETLYTPHELAEALGWRPDQKEPCKLTLSGWEPGYFALTKEGSDAGELGNSGFP